MLNPINPTPTTLAALDGILERLAEHAEGEQRAAQTSGDSEGAVLCRNHARAYRKAQLFLADSGRWRVSPAGALLVLSSTGKGEPYTVRRAPNDGDEFSPIVCSCPHGSEGDRLGICWHVGLLVACEQLPGAVADERDAEAGPLPFEVDPELASLLALEGPPDGDWYLAEHLEAEANYGAGRRRAMAA